LPWHAGGRQAIRATLAALPLIPAADRAVGVAAQAAAAAAAGMPRWGPTVARHVSAQPRKYVASLDAREEGE
jgi:hypothetical protein